MGIVLTYKTAYEPDDSLNLHFACGKLAVVVQGHLKGCLGFVESVRDNGTVVVLASNHSPDLIFPHQDDVLLPKQVILIVHFVLLTNIYPGCLHTLLSPSAHFPYGTLRFAS